VNEAIWQDALHAAALVAVDPLGLGGATVRAGAGPTRDRWLDALRAALPADTPVRRLPAHVTDDRLLGGLDLAATLRAGRVVAEKGVLAHADGGVVVVPMAERLGASTTAHLATALDRGEVVLERDGLARRMNARVAVIALDEGIEPDERAPAALDDRLALRVALDGIPPAVAGGGEAVRAPAVSAARARLQAVNASDDVVRALCAAALTLGVGSVRASYFALRAARAAAALAGRREVGAEDAELAARLILGPRATRIPAPEEPAPEDEPPEPDPPPDEPDRSQDEPPPDAERDDVGDRPLDDVVLAAAQAALPAGLLESLVLAPRRRSPSAGGPSGELKMSNQRGRPTGVRRGDPRRARLNVVETLRAAAPWQGVRTAGPNERRVAVRAEDFRITRYKRRSETTTIFAVDASGSAALQRLAEAKGAVEQLLADCYVRRDHVALLAFRGTEAQLLLPPTRSLVRAKRGLAGLPGGGTTPLAAGIDAASALAEEARRKGHTPVVVLMTDGRANVARDGSPGRAQAAEDARVSARAVRASGLPALFIDTGPRAQPAARELAGEMAATYLHLPYADAAGISQVVQSVAAGGDASRSR
jgi:magnesium chelatase subunit D